MIKNFVTYVLIALSSVLVITNMVFALGISVEDIGFLSVEYYGGVSDTTNHYLGFSAMYKGFQTYMVNADNLISLKNALVSVRQFMYDNTFARTWLKIYGVDVKTLINLYTQGDTWVNTLLGGYSGNVLSYLYFLYGVSLIWPVMSSVFIMPIYSNIVSIYTTCYVFELYEYVSWLLKGNGTGTIIEVYDYETGEYTGGNGAFNNLITSIHNLKPLLPF